MADENGLELSLGLSCGGSSSKVKHRDAPSDVRVEEGSSNRNTNESDVSFKNFFTWNQDQNEKQKSEPVLRQQENFWTDLGNRSASLADGSNDAHGKFSQFLKYQELWGAKSKSTDNEGEKSSSTKRKTPFEDISAQKKHERVVELGDSLGKGLAGVASVMNSHVSGTTEDGSSGENEEVTESEAEGSNSWLISQHEDNAKNSVTLKCTDRHVTNDPTGKQPIVSENESSHELGKVAYGIPLSLQPFTVMTLPYPLPVKIPDATNAPNATVFPSPCVMQLVPVGNGECPVVQAMDASSLQLDFGYSSMHLPTLETGLSWAFGSQLHRAASFASRDHPDGTPNSENPENVVKISHASIPALHSSTLDLMRGGGKLVGDAGTSSSSHPKDEGKGNTTIFRPNEAGGQPVLGGFIQGLSSIRPGVASNLKFEGCGSYPDLPWVSTTGPGPNGRTISGVTYRYEKDQIKIVCACHGYHMTPEEFVEHASEDAPSEENNTALASFTSSKPATWAQS